MKFPDLDDSKLAEFTRIMLGDGCIGIYDCKSKNRIKTQYQTKITIDSREEDFAKHILN